MTQKGSMLAVKWSKSNNVVFWPFLYDLLRFFIKNWKSYKKVIFADFEIFPIVSNIS